LLGLCDLFAHDHNDIATPTGKTVSPFSMDWMRVLEISPPFREFAPGDSPDHDSAELDLPLTLPIRCPPDVAHHNLISLGDDVFDRHVEYRENAGRLPPDTVSALPARALNAEVRPRHAPYNRFLSATLRFC
jgi:hypothetical protein